MIPNTLIGPIESMGKDLENFELTPKIGHKYPISKAMIHAFRVK